MRPDAILRCGLTAASADEGYTVFAIHNGGECQASTDVNHLIIKGPDDLCVEGKGKSKSYDVYIFQGNYIRILWFLCLA